MATGKYERSLINRACRKLGAPHSTTPDAVAVKLLKPYLKGALSVSNKKRRAELAQAAKAVLKGNAGAEINGNVEFSKAHKDAKPKVAKKKSDAFYASWEWKAARYEALKLHGRRCQCCGWRPGDTPLGHLVVDHIKPRSKHPELQLDVSNLQCLCNDCNMGKSNVYEDDFRDIEDWFSNLMRE